jgi:hypothetical protein
MDLRGMLAGSKAVTNHRILVDTDQAARLADAASLGDVM